METVASLLGLIFAVLGLLVAGGMVWHFLTYFIGFILYIIVGLGWLVQTAYHSIIGEK